MMTKPAAVFLLLLFFFRPDALSQDFISKETAEDSGREIGIVDYTKEWGSVNKVQPVSIGGQIYTITKLEAESEEVEEGRYRKERRWEIRKYTYTGFEDDSIKVLYSRSNENEIQDTMVRFDAGPKGRTQGSTDTKEISIPLDSKRQGRLETVDGKTLILTVVDENGRITATAKEQD